MTILNRLLTVLRSKGVLFWLLALWFLYYLTAAVWGTEAFGRFVTGLRENYLFKLLYLLGMVNLLLNMSQRGIGVFKMGVPAFLLWAPLALGLVLLPLGFFMSTNFKQTERIIAGEGDTVGSVGRDSLYTVKSIQSHFRESILDIDEEKNFFTHEPEVVLTDGKADSSVGVYPPRKIGGSYFHIMEFGLAPGIRLKENGKTVIEGYMPQRLLPPGSSDLFTVNGLPYRFDLRLSPEKIIEKGRVTARVYNMRTPVYRVRVLEGEQPVWEGVSASKITFRNHELSFSEPGFWVRLEIVRDSGVPVVLAALSFIFLGMPARLAFLILERKRTASFIQHAS